MLPERAFTVTLIEKRVWREGLVSLRFARPAEFHFKPGQFARIGLTGEDGTYVGRAYSTASRPEDPFIEFFIVAIEGGALSPRLTALEVGDEAVLEAEPMGFMTPDRIGGGSVLWLLSSGTGLAPFIGLIRNEEIWKEWPTVVAVHSVRNCEDLAYEDFFKEVSEDPRLAGAEGRRLCYIPVVTREKTEHLSERIPALIESGALEEAAGVRFDSEESRVMLCGNPDMVQDVRNLLKKQGFVSPRRGNPGNLLAETLW